MKFGSRAASCLTAALLAAAAGSVTAASADWFNWYNGVVGAHTMRQEGNHNIRGLENVQTGPRPCVGIGGYYDICAGADTNEIRQLGSWTGYVRGGNGDSVSHYDHLWWCNVNNPPC
jgi:hypothetical protein